MIDRPRPGRAGTRSPDDVRGRGSGVPDAELERVFDPFVRVGTARERGTGGYGLGLAIARRAMVLHGGRIEAFNSASGGLTVRISLPSGVAA